MTECAIVVGDNSDHPRGPADRALTRSDMATFTTSTASPLTKRLSDVELRAADTTADGTIGAFAATFSTFNVIDQHGDVTLPGAFRDGAAVLVGAYQHNLSALPIGRGVIHTDDRRAWVEGAFFDTAAGREAYATLRAAPDLVEWSYVYTVEEASPGEWEGADGRPVQVRLLKSVDVWSVDPVLRGAGVDVRTEWVKGLAPDGAAAATRFADLPLADRGRRWDAAAAERRVRAWADAEDGPNPRYARAFFWMADDGDDNGDGVPDTFQSYKLGFADVVDGELRAVPRGIFAAAAAMMGGRGGVDIPERDVSGVKAHIARYYRKMAQIFDDDNIVPPWEREGSAYAGLAFVEHAGRLAADVELFAARAGVRADVRRKEGRVLSRANVERLAAIAESLRSAAADLEQLVEEATAPKQDIQAMWAAYQRTLALLHGISAGG